MPKSIVLIGDSLSAGPDTPGGQLAANLRSEGHLVTVDALMGRSAYSFFKNEDGAIKLDRLSALSPDVVIVMLGTNDVGLDTRVDGEMMRRIKDAFRAPVVAIGPPKTAMLDTEPVVVMMREVFDTFIDARPLTPMDLHSPDGIHFTAQGGSVLGSRLADAFFDLSRSDSWWLLLGAAILGIWYAFS